MGGIDHQKWGGLFPIYRKIKTVPNHQPVLIYPLEIFRNGDFPLEIVDLPIH
jgi:hypothetical protein